MLVFYHIKSFYVCYNYFHEGLVLGGTAQFKRGSPPSRNLVNADCNVESNAEDHRKSGMISFVE